MKILLILMILLSLFTGVPTNKGWFILYEFEFWPLTDGDINAEQLMFLIIWIPLVLSHLGLAALLFMTQKSYFHTLLVIIPLAFLFLFIVFMHLSAPLLVPFLLVWFVALIKASKDDVKRCAGLSITS